MTDRQTIPSAPPRGMLWALLQADRRLGVTHWPIQYRAAPPTGRRSAPSGSTGPPSTGSPGQANVDRGDTGAPAGPARMPAQSPSAIPRLDPAEVIERLRVLDLERVKPCTRCGLAKARTQTVFGQGPPDARLVFVGEAPGFDEDRKGYAFVGRAGELLTRMITAMGTSREAVFICNVIKCRPPGNRTPAPDEIAACMPYLREQLTVIRPEVIVALGATAAQALLQTGQSLGRLRGRFHKWPLSDDPAGPSIDLMATYHPAYLLRSPDQKNKTWADLKLVMTRLGLARPG